MSRLRPFWRYYGGKWRAAPRYPPPLHATIIEPFAGAAGYSLRYPERNVILVEKYAVIAEMWRWLIGVTRAEVLAIPEVFDLDDLPAWVPPGARALVGFGLAEGAGSPRQRQSPVARRNRGTRPERPNSGNHARGWSPAMKERVALQVEHIRHWRVIEGDYTDAPGVVATWFVDPPYQVAGDKVYIHKARDIDYAALGAWCRARRGQVLVCENAGATWLPFQPLYTTSTKMNGAANQEMLWSRAGAPKGPIKLPF
jgi:hypothetical protein